MHINSGTTGTPPGTRPIIPGLSRPLRNGWQLCHCKAHPLNKLCAICYKTICLTDEYARNSMILLTSGYMVTNFSEFTGILWNKIFCLTDEGAHNSEILLTSGLCGNQFQ